MSAAASATGRLVRGFPRQINNHRALADNLLSCLELARGFEPLT